MFQSKPHFQKDASLQLNQPNTNKSQTRNLSIFPSCIRVKEARQIAPPKMTRHLCVALGTAKHKSYKILKESYDQRSKHFFIQLEKVSTVFYKWVQPCSKCAINLSPYTCWHQRLMHKLDIPRNLITNLLSQGQPMSIVLSGPFAASIHRWTILTAEEDSRNQESNSPQTSDFLPEVTTAYLGLACNIIQEKNNSERHIAFIIYNSSNCNLMTSSIFKPFRTFEGRKVKKHCFVKPLYTYHQPAN